MYPLDGNLTYPKNQWYVAAFADEIGRTLMERTILDEPVVFYRAEAGEAVALAGLCPHRKFPLVNSTLDGDVIRCGYHGLAFDKTGACVHIPSQDKIPNRMCTRTYPLVETGPLIWIWPGDPSKADVALLPDFRSVGVDAPGWVASPNGRIDLRARYMLLVDNLMDLTHIGFVHAATIPAMDFMIPEAAVIEEHPDVLRVVRRMKNHAAAPYQTLGFPDYHGKYDSAVQTEFFSTAFISSGNPSYKAAPQGGGDYLGTLNFIHIVTPETLHSTHYFSVVTRDFRVGDEPEFEDLLLSGDRAVRAEDKHALELIEQRLRNLEGNVGRELSVLADRGALLARRRIIAQIQAEAPEVKAPSMMHASS